MTPRLSLEPLEARENPSGGGTHPMFAIVDRTPDAPRVAHDDVWVDGKVITGQDFNSASQDLPLKGEMIPQNSAIVFVGGWGSSMYQYS
jgi:hypothetical protein